MTTEVSVLEVAFGVVVEEVVLFSVLFKSVFLESVTYFGLLEEGVVEEENDFLFGGGASSSSSSSSSSDSGVFVVVVEGRDLWIEVYFREGEATCWNLDLERRRILNN
jgi:hypothetical protein